MASFGITLRRERLRRNLGVRDAAAAAGISPSTWQQAERRTAAYGMNTATVAGIARVLGMNEEELLSLSETTQASELEAMRRQLHRKDLRIDELEQEVDSLVQRIEELLGAEPAQSGVRRNAPPTKPMAAKSRAEGASSGRKQGGDEARETTAPMSRASGS